MSVSAIIEAHRECGRSFSANGVGSFALDQGHGEPVLLMHGVPSSSFMYRKVIGALADREMRGLAFDLPGLGLADRPKRFDYSWTGLGRFSIAAVNALGLDRFHLVVHDIGGPIGFELAAAMPDRIRSLTILDSPIYVKSFSRPWVMEPFAHPAVARAWLATMRPPFFVPLMRLVGITNHAAMSTDEINAYPALLKRGDGGTAFLKIMRGFELTAAKQSQYLATLRSASYPVQIVWGRDDPALKIDIHGAQARQALPNAPFHEIPGKHFFVEEQPELTADLIAGLASPSQQPAHVSAA